MQEKRKRKRGLAAIFAMAVFVFITILAMGVLRISDSNTMGIRSELMRIQAEYIARAGLEIGMQALLVKHPVDGVTLCDKVLEIPTDPSLHLKEGYTNFSSGNPKGDVIEIKDSTGKKIGDVQIIIYSLTGKPAEPKMLEFEYQTPVSPPEKQLIDRGKQIKNLGIESSKKSGWVFHVVAVGQAEDYEKWKESYPMARQIMTAEMSMQNPEVVKIYSGF